MESTQDETNNAADATRMEKESVSSGSTSSIGYDDFFFGKFCRHVPRILRHQLISKLVNQYVYKTKEIDDTSTAAPNRVVSKTGDAGVDFKANSSIYRFHCALLFVDISGFTVLSQKLKVDDLKNHINAYFQKIVDIIDKYDGEIIKFAGDALFIVWQTKVSDLDNANFLQASKDATDKAVSCGKEINIECGNYPIKLGSGNSEGSSKVQKFLQSIEAPNDTGATRRSPRKSPRPSSRPGTATRKKPKEARVTYLNIHAGVSVGVMAGLDVGAQDRFEYLLLGQPMNDVAIAEGDAGKGEIVISPAAHALLHNFTSLHSAPTTARGIVKGGMVGVSDDAVGDSTEPAAAGPATEPKSNTPQRRQSSLHPLACGCTLTPSGYFKINSELDDALCVVDFSAAAAQRSNNSAMMHLDVQEFEGNTDLQYEFEIYAQVIEELMCGYKVVSPLLQVEFAALLKQMNMEPAQEVKGDQVDNTLSVSGSSDLGRRANFEYTEKEVLTEHFFAWAQHCLLDDIAKHVHEVVRKGFSFYHESRASPFEQFLNSPTMMENFRRELERTSGGGIVRHSAARHSGVGSVGNQSTSPHGSVHSVISPRSTSVSTISPVNSKHNSRADGPTVHRNSNGGRHGESFVTKMRHLTGLGTLRDRKHNKHQKVLSKDGALVSELRNVIVLFISVKMDHSSLFHDPLCGSRDVGRTIQTCKVSSFHFLNRTIDEIEADKKLINQFQSCMEVLTEVFHAKGGQLRQFIVDDKGTVCIGTFGLRGSVNYDNAASAIDAADSIVARLQALGFNASVGVTSGAAYCGLVGSHTRHEYAVMGPSTNLSARLMGRAAEGEIICDTTIRQRDRTHAFASLGAVKAKGYTNPVPIFQPHFGGADNEAAQLSLKNPSEVSSAAVEIPSKIYGRKDVAVEIFRFFVCDAIKGGLDDLIKAFWIPTASEDEAAKESLAYIAAPFDFTLKGVSSSKKNARNIVQSAKKVRFDPHMTIKKFVVMSPNGLGKTAVLNLMQHKIRALVERDEEYYNIAVFRHQVGYINSTTLFSAWFCMIRQTMYSIAECLAATGDAHAAQCLAAMQADDCTPLVEFLKDYLPPMLRPYTPLLSLVGIKFKAPAEVATSPEGPLPVVEEGLRSDGADDADPGMDDMAPDSGKTDPISVLDPKDKLERCAELIVEIIQLHVAITRRVTLYIMDDLQLHDMASQDLGRLISDRVTGVLLLSTYRCSPQASYEPLRADSSGQPLTLADASAMFGGPGVGFFEAAMRSMPESDTFHKLELTPLSKFATKKLLLRIFTNFGVTGVDDAVLDKLHALSNGSPLYATELAKAVCDRYIARECTQITVETSACSINLLSIIDSMRTDRIEEMVHFRFDKLTEQCQLVLKMAAVASLNGSHFTLSMLTSILDSSDKSESAKLDAMISTTKALLGYLSDPDEDGENVAFNRGNPINSSMDLVQAINDLLESEDFIEYRGEMTTTGAPPPEGASEEEVNETGAGSSYNAMQLLTVATPITPKPDLTRLQSESNSYNRHGSRDRSTLQQLRFHWKVDMELRAIYDLMLEEQKESLHDRVASFLEQEAQKNDSLTATDWYEQAFHWERATAWSSAMTCYFHSGMLLKEQGDAQGARAHFTAAYKMMDRMRHDAGVKFLDGTRITTECAAAQDALTCAPVYRPTVQNFSEIDKSSQEYLLLNRNVGMKLEDLHRMFEASSALLYTGLSVLVRLAQALNGFATAEYSYRMCEDALDILILSHCSSVTTKLDDVDGGMFMLRDDNIGFPVFSGLFLLLLNDAVFEVDKYQRMVAVVALHMAFAGSKPEYEVHLILAYQNKVRLLESFIHMDANAIPPIITYTNTMWVYYDQEKHSKDLVHYYNSDRTGNATSVVVKVLYMQGHFAQCAKYLNLIKETAFKIKHFFSTASTVFAAYSMFLLCYPNAEAQVIMEKLAAREAKQMNKEMAEPIQIFREALNLTVQHQQYGRSGEEAVFDKESAFVENVLQSRTLVQKDKANFQLNLARRYHVAVEYVAARICYLKALRYELCAAAMNPSNTDAIAAHRAKALAYLQLGLEHLMFTPAEDARNEQHVFAKANERLLRVQILLKLIVTCEDATQARAMWINAQENLEQTVRLAQRCNFQLILLQAGLHLESLAALSLPAMAVEEAGESSAADQLRPSLQAQGAALESEARAYMEKMNKDSCLDLEGIYRSILMQYPSA